MRKYQIEQLSEALDELEKAIIRNGLVRKHLLEVKSLRAAIDLLRKKADKNELR